MHFTNYFRLFLLYNFLLLEVYRCMLVKIDMHDVCLNLRLDSTIVKEVKNAFYNSAINEFVRKFLDFCQAWFTRN